MFELYGIADEFFNALLSLGDFLVDTPFVDVFDNLVSNGTLGPLFDVFNTLLIAVGFSDGLSGLFSGLGFAHLSVASFIFGAGLIFVIVFKIVKFFTDIVL